jgi:excisionase family DNA binding protein
MPNFTEFISTKEVAGLFSITETTVKRWSDEGLIPCVKSPGGHRKFRLSDVVEFAEKQGYPVTGTLEPPLTKEQMETVQFAIHTQNYHKIAEVLYDEALQADPEGVFQLLNYLSKHNIKLSTLADEVLRPPMVRIGELWKDGKLQIDQEHRTSHAMTEAMVRLVPQLHKKDRNGLKAVCACLEGEQHEIGLRSLAFALETEGFRVDFLGSNTPIDSLISSVKQHKPNLVCVSFTSSAPHPHLLDAFSRLAKAVRSVGGRLVAGGYFAGNFTAEKLHCDYLASSVTDGISFVRDAFSLKPGPRKKARTS